jgi:hypothetical protein
MMRKNVQHRPWVWAFAFAVLVSAGALVWLEPWTVVNRPFRASLFEKDEHRVEAAKARLNRAKKVRMAVAAVDNRLRDIATKLDSTTSNTVNTAVSRLEKHVSENEAVAGVELQVLQCDSVVAACSKIDEAQDFARRLTDGGITALTSRARADQTERPYKVKVPTADRERALRLLSRPMWTLPPPQTNSAGRDFADPLGRGNAMEPSSASAQEGKDLFAPSTLSLSLARRRKGVSDPAHGSSQRIDRRTNWTFDSPKAGLNDSSPTLVVLSRKSDEKERMERQHQLRNLFMNRGDRREAVPG